MHGALQEARHVFIAHGLACFSHRELRLLEIGFGTGLNALVSLLVAPTHSLKIHYTGLEAHPITEQEWQALDYGRLFEDPAAPAHYERLHRSPWEEPVRITPDFSLVKQQADLLGFTAAAEFDLIYFDAFGPRVQPELWTEPVFESMYEALTTGGHLVTYSAKGSVRRAMLAAGFTVERLPGPPGKREMLRAAK